ncbi:MAG TPA: hypothetical protein DIS79_11045 [Bacteroidetes bacterium]|nr:hypothetical protein [Bacteroidota bacterium]
MQPLKYLLRLFVVVVCIVSTTTLMKAQSWLLESRPEQGFGALWGKGFEKNEDEVLYPSSRGMLITWNKRLRTWSVDTLPTNESLLTVIMVDDTVIVGSSEGRVWQRFGSGPWSGKHVANGEIRRLQRIRGQTFLVTSGGELGTYSAFDQRFIVRYSEPGNEYFHVEDFGDELLAYGRIGTIVRSTNSGDTWSVFRSGGEDSWYSIARGQGDTVVLGAGRSRVIRSFDRGKTLVDSTMLMNVPVVFSEKSTKTQHRILVVKWYDGGFFAGGELTRSLGRDADSLFHSTDAGKTWRGIGIPRAYKGLTDGLYPRDLRVGSDGRGWCLSMAGGDVAWMFRTNDHCRTWQLDTILPTRGYFLEDDTSITVIGFRLASSSLYGTPEEIYRLRRPFVERTLTRLAPILERSIDRGERWMQTTSFDENDVWTNADVSFVLGRSGNVYQYERDGWLKSTLTSPVIDDSLIEVEWYGGSGKELGVARLRVQRTTGNADTIRRWVLTTDHEVWDTLPIQDTEGKLIQSTPHIADGRIFIPVAYEIDSGRIGPRSILIWRNDSQRCDTIVNNDSLWRAQTSLPIIHSVRGDTIVCHTTIRVGARIQTIVWRIHTGSNSFIHERVMFGTEDILNVSSISTFDTLEILVASGGVYVKHRDSSQSSWARVTGVRGEIVSLGTTSPMNIGRDTFIFGKHDGTVILRKTTNATTTIQSPGVPSAEVFCNVHIINQESIYAGFRSITSARAYTLDGRELPLSWSFAAPILTYERPVSGPFLLVLMDEKGTVCAELLQ